MEFDNHSDSEEVFNDISVDRMAASRHPVLRLHKIISIDARKSLSSVFDRPHRFTIHETYAIPFFPGCPKILQLAFSDWQVSAFTELQSGQPFTITVGVDTLGSGTTCLDVPNLNPGGIMIAGPGYRQFPDIRRLHCSMEPVS